MIFHILYFFTFIINLKPVKLKKLTHTILKTIRAKI